MSASTTAPKLPIDTTSGTIDSFDSAEIQELIKQNVKMVLLTNPGERIMIPDFGVGIITYLFDQSTSDYMGLEVRIKDQLRRYVPSIDLTNVSVNPLGDEHKLEVSLSYDIDFLKTRDRLDLLLEF